MSWPMHSLARSRPRPAGPLLPRRSVSPSPDGRPAKRDVGSVPPLSDGPVRGLGEGPVLSRGRVGLLEPVRRGFRPCSRISPRPTGRVTSQPTIGTANDAAPARTDKPCGENTSPTPADISQAPAHALKRERPRQLRVRSSRSSCCSSKVVVGGACSSDRDHGRHGNRLDRWHCAGAGGGGRGVGVVGSPRPMAPEDVGELLLRVCVGRRRFRRSAASTRLSSVSTSVPSARRTSTPCTGSGRSVGREDVERWEELGVSRPVARQERSAGDRRVGGDVEVRQW